MVGRKKDRKPPIRKQHVSLNNIPGGPAGPLGFASLAGFAREGSGL
jgi:hypothetical protein